MATRNQRSNAFLPEALFKFDHIETRVQEHLKRVYGTLSIAMLAAAAGAYVDMHTKISNSLLTFIGSIGLMLWLASTHHSKENEKMRLGIFTGFTFFCGMSLGNLLDMVISIDPSIITTALLGTTLIFVSFSLASLYNRNRSFLYMGGFLLSALSYMCLAGFMNMFFRSKLLMDESVIPLRGRFSVVRPYLHVPGWIHEHLLPMDINLYGGLLLFCAFILYDTQMIIEKARMGDSDYIWHSVDLFLDFINIFRRLLIILSRKEEGKKRRRD